MRIERLLILGGAGFIGSNFTRLMAAQRPELRLVVYDALTYAGSLVPLRALNTGRVTFVRGDIRDHAALMPHMATCDAVVNFAACSHVDYSIADPRPFMDTNATGVLTILECIAQPRATALPSGLDGRSLRRRPEGPQRRDGPPSPVQSLQRVQGGG